MEETPLHLTTRDLPIWRSQSWTRRVEAGLLSVFYALLIWLPLPLGSNRPWAWALLILCSFALLMGSLWVRRYASDQHWTGLTLPIGLWLALLLWLLCQWMPLPHSWLEWISPYSHELYKLAESQRRAISLDPAQTQVNLYKTLGYFALFLTTLLLINSKSRLQQLLLVLTISGCIQACYGSLEVLSGLHTSLLFGYPVGEAATGSFVYKNHFANFLMLSLAAGTGYLLASLRQTTAMNHKQQLRAFLTALFNGKGMVRIGLILMVIALVLSRSRMGNVAFFTALAVTGVMAMLLIRKKSPVLKWLLISLVAVDLLIVSSWFGLSEVQQRLANTELVTEDRYSVVQMSMPLVQVSGWSGLGAGSFYTLFPAVQDADMKHFYDHLHNDYLQFWIEFGGVGVAVLLLLVIASVSQAVIALQQRRDPRILGCAFACVLAVIGMALHAAFDFPLQSPANAAYFVVLLALCWQCRNLPSPSVSAP